MNRTCFDRIARILAALWVLSCLGATAALAEAAPPPAVATPRAEVEAVDLAKLFDAVVETTEKHFHDDELLRRMEWSKRAAAIRPAVVSARTPEDAARELNKLLAELRTSHTALFTPNDYEYAILLDIVGPGANSNNLLQRKFWGSAPHYPGIGAFTKRIGETYFIDGVMEGSPADKAGLKYGDEILAVDGAPYSPIAAFREKTGSTVELTIRRSAGSVPKQLRVPVLTIMPGKAFSMATAASARVIEAGGKRIGYVHVWASHDASGFKSALEKLGEDTKWDPLDSLIVDMRGRVGGNIGVANDYLDILGGRANAYWGDYKMFFRSSRGSPHPDTPPFRGRTALLIDDHTRSAAEIMAYGFKRSGFGPVLGTRTAGAVSSGATFVMPGDFLLYLAGSRIEFEGRSLEGVGVTPDHVVERPLPYAGGADPVIDAAVELLTRAAG